VDDSSTVNYGGVTESMEWHKLDRGKRFKYNLEVHHYQEQEQIIHLLWQQEVIFQSGIAQQQKMNPWNGTNWTEVNDLNTRKRRCEFI
jgi:hypothetical protein